MAINCTELLASRNYLDNGKYRFETVYPILKGLFQNGLDCVKNCLKKESYHLNISGGGLIV